MMVQLTHSHGGATGSTGLIVGSDAGLSEAKRHFAEHHAVKLTSFLDDKLLARVVGMIHLDSFYTRDHGAFGSELCLRDDSPVPGLLWLLMNDERLFRVVEDITGCPRIACFDGRVYRVTASSEVDDGWHDDLVQDRLIALSLNLSPTTYEGGVLQIRDRGTQELLEEAPNTGLGDAVIFRLAPGLQHRITRVQGEHEKTAYAGWFKGSPDYRTILRRGSA